MIELSYMLEYTQKAIEDMSASKREVFSGPLRKFVITTTQRLPERVICFHFYYEHFIEVVTKWPWLLCSDLGKHLETRSSDTETDWVGIFGRTGP
jgi:hypothetical protein